MKHLLISFLSGVGILLAADLFVQDEKPVLVPGKASGIENNKEVVEINFSSQPGQQKMSAVVFKRQKYCRAEVEQFDFDAPFSVVSATIYFSGTNFKSVEKGTITSSSLEPVAGQMARCATGTIVIFDDVKVMGPDKEIRTIQGLSLVLH